MTTYPSLFAALEPQTAADGTRGSRVRCTATQRELGFVWWSADGNHVTWHWRTGTTGGVRSTKRNAVQALRDVSNAARVYGGRVPLDEREPEPEAPTTTSAPAARPARVAPAPVVPKPAQQIVWDDAAPAFDLSAALAASFKKEQR